MDGVVELIEAHAAPYLLVLARVGGLFIYAPLLSSAAVPARGRALLAAAMTAALYPALLGSGRAPAGSTDLASLGALVVGETLIGLALGVLAGIPVLAAQVGGMIVGQQLGLGLASVYNPAMDTDGDVTGELLMYLALAVFLAAGGLEVLFLALAGTYERVPAGGLGASDVPLGVLTGLLQSGFELALRVSAPVLCILLIETLASSFIMRTLPQMNIMTIGFAIKVVLGFGALIVGIYAAGDAVWDEVERGLHAALTWSRGLGGAEH